MRFFLLIALMSALFALPWQNASAKEGFYKDIFMDGGVSLTSRRSLPAAESLGLTYEFYAGSDPGKQRELFTGGPLDDNGVLLYPDGQPRFRMLYVNGGHARKHGESLELAGRNALRRFNRNGGSYSGSCAGSFLSGRNINSNTPRKLGYLHIFPYNTLTTGIKKTPVGHDIPRDSPLLKYHDFGGDHHVAQVRHNGGNWLSRDALIHMKGVEVLATYDHPGHKVDKGAAIWAYKRDSSTGRVLSIGSHPEAVTSGERLEMTAACFRYALEGVGSPTVKGVLKDGVTRVMDRSSGDRDPAHARIGDLQYHHFTLEIPAASTPVQIELEGEEGFDFCLYLNKDRPAFRSSAKYSNTATADTRILKAVLEKGKWFVGVECSTTVVAGLEESRRFFNYSGNTAVLNGAAYRITTHLR